MSNIMSVETIEMIGIVIGEELTEDQWELLRGVYQPPLNPMQEAAEGFKNGMMQLGEAVRSMASGHDLEVIKAEIVDDEPEYEVKPPDTVILCTPVQHGGNEMERAIEAWVAEGYCLVGPVRVANFDVSDNGDYDPPHGVLSYHQGPHFYATMTRKKDRKPNVTIYGGQMDGLVVEWGVALRLWGQKMINKPTLDGVVNAASKGDKATLEQWQEALKYAQMSEEL